MAKLNQPEDARLTSGHHISYWTNSAQVPLYNTLKQDIETEVVIVGGGIAGVTTAYSLLKAGKKVVLVEDGIIGSGETGRTTAHLVTALDDRYYELQRIFGPDKTKLIAESHQMAIDFVEQTVKEENINCEFERVNGFLFLHPSDEEKSLEKELDATYKAGVAIDKMDEIPGLLQKKYGLRFTGQAQFHPLQYLAGLCMAIEHMGGQIYSGTHASKIDNTGIETSDGHKVKAQHVVVATNSPVNNLFTMFEKQYAYRTYVIGALVKKDKLPHALWWDTGDFNANKDVPPYHYVRVSPYNSEYDLLISGGEDHPTGDTSATGVAEDDRYRLVEEWTREHFAIEQVIHKWSGQVIEPMDGLAFIGRNPLDHKNVYIITGDSGNGMTHCTFGALLITDLIMGRENKFEKLYSPYRFTLKESAPVFKQMMHELISFCKQTPNFNGTKELDKINNGEGKVVDMLEEQFGVYRQPDGALNIVSAQCTHLKCSLAWNKDELSWDCPCHGSRFTYNGKVINGPANRDLPHYNEQEFDKK